MNKYSKTCTNRNGFSGDNVLLRFDQVSGLDWVFDMGGIIQGASSVSLKSGFMQIKMT